MRAAIDLKTIPGILSDTPMSGAVKQLSLSRWALIGSRPVLGFAVLCALLTGFGVTPLHAGQPKVNKHENRNEIYQLEEVWRNAMLKADTSAMSNLLSDDYVAITSAGTLQTKADAINNLRTRRMHVTTLDVADRKIRFYGNTAVVTSLASVQANTPDGDVSGSFRYTRVYVRDAQDKWKIVSFEASRIRQPGERRHQPNSAQ